MAIEDIISEEEIRAPNMEVAQGGPEDFMTDDEMDPYQDPDLVPWLILYSFFFTIIWRVIVKPAFFCILWKNHISIKSMAYFSNNFSLFNFIYSSEFIIEDLLSLSCKRYFLIFLIKSCI